MSVLPLIESNSILLNLKSSRIGVFDNNLRTLCNDLIETMIHNRGIGIAAVQCGILKQVAIIGVTNHFPIINPEIIEASGNKEYTEGCLSLPGETHRVNRFTYIKVKYQDITGKIRYIKAKNNLLCQCLQHEISHINGKLIRDN